MTLKNKLDLVFSREIFNLTSFGKARLYQNHSSHFNSSELINECYLWCLEQVGEEKGEEDYLKLAKAYINNQTRWNSSPGSYGKENSKNFKNKHKIIGFDNSRLEYDPPEEYLEDNIEFAYWVEKYIDRPEKNLFRLYYIEGHSHRTIAEMIRKSGIKICDTSVYLELKKLKGKIKELSRIWKEL